MSGYVALHRSFLDWEWYSDANAKCLFLHCLIKANWQDKKWQGLTICRGSFITSLSSLSKDTGLTVKQVRTALDKLTSTNNLSVKGANKYSTVTVVNYDLYQNITPSEGNQGASKGQTEGNQGATTNNINNLNKEKNKRGGRKFSPPTLAEVIDYFKENGYTKQAAEKAFNYYSPDWEDSKGNKVLNWRLKMKGVWFKDEHKDVEQKREMVY